MIIIGVAYKDLHFVRLAVVPLMQRAMPGHRVEQKTVRRYFVKRGFIALAFSDIPAAVTRLAVVPGRAWVIDFTGYIKVLDEHICASEAVDKIHVAPRSDERDFKIELVFHAKCSFLNLVYFRFIWNFLS